MGRKAACGLGAIRCAGLTYTNVLVTATEVNIQKD